MARKRSSCADGQRCAEPTGSIYRVPCACLADNCELVGMPKSADPWEAWEDSTLLTFYPDLRKLRAELPHRSRFMIKTRGRVLGVSIPRMRWSAQDDIALRIMDNRVTVRKQAKILGRTYEAVQSRRKELGLCKPNSLAPHRTALTEDVRQRVRSLGVTYRKAASLVGVSGSSLATTSKSHSETSVALLATKLGGQVYVEWLPVNESSLGREKATSAQRR